MASTAILCTDGSDISDLALRKGYALLDAPDSVVVVTVVAEPSVVLPYDASGLAGAAVPPEELVGMQDELVASGQQLVDRTAAALGLTSSDNRVLVGEAGHAIVDLAVQLGADVVVMGSRGHGGLRRAVLGSVSDHVIRHAHCPVLVTNAD